MKKKFQEIANAKRKNAVLLQSKSAYHAIRNFACFTFWRQIITIREPLPENVNLKIVIRGCQLQHFPATVAKFSVLFIPLPRCMDVGLTISMNRRKS